jgi:hypothetical protein
MRPLSHLCAGLFVYAPAVSSVRWPFRLCTHRIVVAPSLFVYAPAVSSVHPAFLLYCRCLGRAACLSSTQPPSIVPPARPAFGESCKNAGFSARLDAYGAKSCENTVIFFNFCLFGLIGTKFLYNRRNFCILVILSQEKLHFCSFWRGRPRHWHDSPTTLARNTNCLPFFERL